MFLIVDEARDRGISKGFGSEGNDELLKLGRAKTDFFY